MIAHRVLVLADSQVSASAAARWATGDAFVHIGSPTTDDGRALASERFGAVVVSGDLADQTWLVGAFELAAKVLPAGGPVTLLLHSSASGADRSDVHDLPDAVASAWRLTAFIVEHPVTAVTFAQASDNDGQAETVSSFRRAQLVGLGYRHPELMADVESALGLSRVLGPPACEPAQSIDPDVAQLRRELAAYRESTLGRLTTRYWALRRAVRLRQKAAPGPSTEHE